jgi:adenylylsulfate kinase
MDQPPVTGARALLITGTVGAGKTSVADALGDLLSQREVPNAVIDVDWLRRSWPCPAGDPFNGAMALRNLRAVAGNFLQAGAQRLVLAGVVESRAERHAYQSAVGIPLSVCRISVDLPAVRQRLRRRHRHDDPAQVRWFLDRAGELDGILRRARLDDAVVDASTASVAEAARAVTAAVGW